MMVLVNLLVLVLAIAAATTSVPVPGSSENLLVRRIADDNVLIGSPNRIESAPETAPMLSAFVAVGLQ